MCGCGPSNCADHFHARFRTDNFVLLLTFVPTDDLFRVWLVALVPISLVRSYIVVLSELPAEARPGAAGGAGRAMFSIAPCDVLRFLQIRDSLRACACC